MGAMTSGEALRQLRLAQAGMKKVRQSLALLRREDVAPGAVQAAMKSGWASLSQAYRLLSSIPLEAASDEVLTRQIALQRYATALLVRLRRLARAEGGAEDLDDEFDDAD
jgi:hypothetical protein